MIAKKNSRYDLERKRTALFQVGLLIAGSFTLAAFSYESDIVREQELAFESFETVEYFNIPEEKLEEEKVVEQTPPQETPQDPQQTTSTQAATTVTQTMVLAKNTQNDPFSTIGISGIGMVDTAIIDIPIDDIDPFPPVEAEYIGGYIAMQGFISDNLKYPEVDRMIGEQGKVYLSFIIEKDGSVSNVEVERGVTTTIDREASRVVRLFPKWKPAENAYGVVRTRVRLPINFTIGGD